MIEFTCPRCGATSHQPIDAVEGYCGRCHDWTDPARTLGLGPLHYDVEGRAVAPSDYTRLLRRKRAQQ